MLMIWRRNKRYLDMNKAQQSDLNMIGVLREVWAAKLFLLVGLCVGVLAAVCFSVLAVPKMEARMMVGPAQPMDASMQAEFQDGQNSYVIGGERNNAREAVSNFTRFEAMMRGVRVARFLLRDERIVVGLKNDIAFVFEDGNTDVQPAELAHYIARRVTLDRFGETALREMVYRHRDGKFAAYFVQQIHRISDQLIRSELRGQIDERIGYLERVIAKTNNPEQRRIVTNLLLEQERALMMVSMDAPVAAAVIEPVASGVRAVWPDAGLLYGGVGLVGLLLGYLVFGVVHYQDEENDAGEQKTVVRGKDLRHQPKRPLKYGSWFGGAPDNDVDEVSSHGRALHGRALRDAGDAAE